MEDTEQDEDFLSDFVLSVEFGGDERVNGNYICSGMKNDMLCFTKRNYDNLIVWHGDSYWSLSCDQQVLYRAQGVRFCQFSAVHIIPSNYMV